MNIMLKLGLVIALCTCAVACGDDGGEAPIGGAGGSAGAASGGNGGGAGQSGGTGGTAGATGGASGGGAGGSSGGEGGGGGSGGDGGAGSCDPECGPHGTCTEDGCLCEAGYAGASCEDCAQGFVPSADGERCVADPSCSGSACSDAGAPWLDQWGSDANDVIYALAIDEEGALLAAGRTAGSLPGHTASGGGSDETASGRYADGSASWTAQWGTAMTEEATGVAAGAEGALFVSGHTSGVLGASGFGRADAVLTRLGADHEVEWTVQWGSSETDRPVDMARASDGELLVLGATAGDLARTNPNETTADADLFLTKLTDAGDESWSVQWGAIENDLPTAVAPAAGGGAFVVGGTSGDIDLGDHLGGVDAFCSKLDAEGNVEWTVQWGSDGDEYARAVVALATGEALVVGDRGALEVDQGDGAMLIAWIDGDGTVLSTYAFGATGADVASAVALGDDGAFYVGGVTEGDLVPDAHAGMTDMFVSKRDESGAELWTRQYGTAAEERVEAIALDGSMVYLAGATEGDAAGDNAGALDKLIVGFALE